MSMCNSIIFLYCPCPFNSLNPAVYKLLYALRKKQKQIVEWQATHAPLLSLLDHWRNGGLPKRLCVDQIGDSQKESDQDSTKDASIRVSRSSVRGGFQWYGQQCADGHYLATLRRLSTIVPGVCFE
jgi:hypothetical protein